MPLLCAVHTFGGADPVSIAVNPSAEDAQNGRPVGWGIYQGKGEASVGVSDEARTGRRSACLKATAMGDWQGRSYLNCGLMQGCASGYDGRNAYATEPGTAYRFSFWLKGTVPWVYAQAVCWIGKKAASGDRRALRIVPGRIVPTDTWQRYEGFFVTRRKTTRVALKWHVAGFEDDGMRLGELLVDDVELVRLGQTSVQQERRITIPEKLNVTVLGRPIDELVRLYRASDDRVREAVEARLQRAARWAEKDDSWYLERTGKHTPVGMWTLACPFHPERVRDFSKDNFQWSIDEPWKLVCKLCKAEGRELYYYPNERYPDDGSGCYPTDEVWREDHDEAWSRAHSSIPHDHWDGKAHGYSDAGYCYHFIGKCTHEIMTHMAKRVLPQLAEAYVLTKTLSPDHAAEAQRCARKVKVAMLSLARAHLGDAYLADLFDLSLDEFDSLMKLFHAEDPKELCGTRFPGYKPYDLFDGIAGDPKHPAKRRADLYGDGSYRGDAYARGWLRGYGLIRDSFTDDDEIVRGMIERILVSGEGDTEALSNGTRAKPGKLELAFKPFSMNVGGSNNLGGRELCNQFEFGVLLNDPDVVDAVVSNVWFYLRNYFNSDGLGRETSPAYTNCAWSSMWQIFPKLYGYRGHYDASHPWWDEKLQGLNPYRDPVMKHDVAKSAFALLPDDTTVPWMDSHVGSRPTRRYLDLIANEGGGLPQEYDPLYSLRKLGSRTYVSPRSEAFPSMLLHESKKAVLRSGSGRDRALLSVDYAPHTGHWHPAPMDLVLYAKGHELASDLGYFGAMHWLTKEWIRTCPAHNTCIVRDSTGRHDFMHQVQGELRTLFKPGDPVSVVEVCERDAGDLRHVPGESPVYQRTCALVRVPHDDHYVIDVFRVRGGAWHDYYFHSQGRRCAVAGVDLSPLPPNESLYGASGFLPKQKRPSGSGLIRSLKSGQTGGAFEVTWSTVPDFRGKKVVIDEDVGLRLTMLGQRGTEVFLGEAPGQRRMSNVDLNEKLHVLCARRGNAADVDRFVSVIEPFRGKPFVRSVTRLPVAASEASDVVALRIETDGRTDYAVSVAHLNGQPSTVRFDVGDGCTMETDGLFTFASTVKGQPVFLGLNGGSRAAFAGLCVTLAPSYGGVLTDFGAGQILTAGPAGERRREHVLTVTCDTALPLGDRLEDETIIIEHGKGTTTFTIERVEAAGEGRFDIHLKWTPHVLDNYLRVTGVVGPIVRFEPPQSLAHGYANMGYQACRISPSGEATHVGEVRAASGKSLTLDRLSVELKPGDTIGLTKLRMGADQFRIVSSVSVARL